jgi:hypothetical protein
MNHPITLAFLTNYLLLATQFSLLVTAKGRGAEDLAHTDPFIPLVHDYGCVVASKMVVIAQRRFLPVVSFA